MEIEADLYDEAKIKTFDHIKYAEFSERLDNLEIPNDTIRAQRKKLLLRIAELEKSSAG